MNIDKNLLSGSHTLLILSLIKEEEMYGYQMVVELAGKSEHAFQLKEGTLYPILHTLEKEKYVTSRRMEAENGRNRKYYKITDKGRKLLAKRTQEWEYFAQKVNLVVLGG